MNMIMVSNSEFEQLVANGIDRLPETVLTNLDNVVFVTADCPDSNQRQKARMPILAEGESCLSKGLLFGLYEGVPKTVRGSNYSWVLPDKITIFKRPIEYISSSWEELEKQVNNTVWHEVAHHFGLDHDRIEWLERKSKETI